MQRRRRWYFTLMGVCLALFLFGGLVVVHWSRAAAVVMAGLALVIPPVAVMVANAGRERGD